jgi:hypothetical protein
VEIRIMKKERRTVLTCVRSDGSSTTADLGPGLPGHDLAHFVVERAFHLKEGFFGNVVRGYSLQALGEKDVIKSLGPESWKAEILARALGSLATGACTSGQFVELINTELAPSGAAPLEALEAGEIDALLAELRALLDRYAALGNGESLRLTFG